jgi:hypothetical protein
VVFWHELVLTGSKFDTLRCLCIYETFVILIAALFIQIIVRKWFKDYFFFCCSKVYVQFGRPHCQEMDERHFHTKIPGRVSLAVYKAVKLRQLKIPCTLHLLQ